MVWIEKKLRWSHFITVVKLDTPVRRRKLLETYAQQKGFDPLNPENWYKQKKRDIISMPVSEFKASEIS